MPKKKEPDLTPEEQFKRFQEAANEHEIDRRLPEIEQAFNSIAKSKEGNNWPEKRAVRARKPQ